MSKYLRVFTAIIILTLSILACGLPSEGGNNPTSATEAPASADQVATIVASTLQALTPGVTSAPSSSLLPLSLHFVSNDGAGIAQVFRLERDGKTVKQITFEPTAVGAYDISRVDGSVVYVANNQILLINADGSGRRVLVDGGPVDPNDPFVTSVRSPLFSPNGQTVAYGYQGLNFYVIASGVKNLVLDDILDDFGNGLRVVREAYSPDKYSPDGSKLLLTLHYYEGASSAIYYPAAGSLVRLSGGEGALICCGEAEWTPDGSALFSGSPTLGMFSSGLWRVDASSGKVTTLLSGNAGNNTFNFADEPFLGPDNFLYFFFVNQSVDQEFVSHTPLQLVVSAPDGVTGRSVIRPETFQFLNEALWAPDASFVIVANAPSDQISQGGLIELYYTDKQKGMISLFPFGQQLKWGP